jgi:nitroreductase
VDFQRLIEARYSVRAYTLQPVEQEKLERVLIAAQLAPTAANYQPFRLFVLPTAGREAEVRRVYDREWFVQAPLVIAICWVAAFDPDAARAVLGVPEGIEPLAFTPLGYPADRPTPKTRKALNDLVRYV